jgi:hypothetical protein
MVGRERLVEESPAWAAWRCLAAQHPETADPAGALSERDLERKAESLAKAARAIELLAEYDMPVAHKFGRPERAGGERDQASQVAQAKLVRDAVLRLGLWGALGDWRLAALAAGTDATVAGLLHAIGRSDESIPPFLEASPEFFESEPGRLFFDQHLRGLVEQLARHFDDHRCGFADALRAVPALGRPGARQAWSRLWSRASCALYLDYLRRNGAFRLPQLQAELWRDAPEAGLVQFRPPHGLSGLPTANNSIRFELWSSILLAQLVAYAEERWDTQATTDGLYAVHISMRELSAGSDGIEARPFRTGLVVGMVYQAVLIEQLRAMTLRRRHQDG